MASCWSGEFSTDRGQRRETNQHQNRFTSQPHRPVSPQSARLGGGIAFLSQAMLDEIPLLTRVAIDRVDGLAPARLHLVWVEQQTSTAVARFVRHAATRDRHPSGRTGAHRFRWQLVLLTSALSSSAAVQG